MKISVTTPTIVVLGGINMDLVGVASKLPMPGETVVGERIYTTPGGKGANQAVAAARLGAKVRIVGRVGKDAFGTGLLDGLRSHGIDVTEVAQDPKNASGVAMILLDGQRQNHIVAVYGANGACDDAQLKAAKRAMVGADALLLQQEIPLGVSLAAPKYARSRGVRVIWHPAPALEMPQQAYACIDLLTPNQGEAFYLTGIQVTEVDSARAAAEMLLDKEVPVAVVKMGDHGVYYASAADSGYVPAHRVEAVDTVAAGDAFGAGLGVALSEGRGLRDAVRYGAAAGALAVTKPGAQEAMPARHEVEALFSPK